ncbi:MAG: hypothetical protein HYX63_04245 [Gammaproteobacteria bacterium]|nr:hypothetical protein [Gammaproteobacteria bacterium]
MRVLRAADLTDTDGVCYDPDNNNICDPLTAAAITGTTLRFGRLATQNAFGSELIPLAVPARAEYYNGLGFVPNTDDTCTVIDTSAVDLGIGNFGNPPAQGVPTIALGAGTTKVTITFTPLVAGALGFRFSAPGAGNTGDIDYSINLSAATGARAEWLRYDWNGDGVFDNDPSGRVSFGIFAGRNAIIYQREPWN